MQEDAIHEPTIRQRIDDLMLDARINNLLWQLEELEYRMKALETVLLTDRERDCVHELAKSLERVTELELEVLDWKARAERAGFGRDPTSLPVVEVRDDEDA